MTAPGQDPNKDKGHEKDHEIPVHIDHKMYKVSKVTMTGAELRGLPQPPISADYDLYREVPGQGDDPKIGDAESVELKEGMHFYSVLRQINPGCADATA